MNEDPTQKLPGSRPFEERVLTEIAATRGDIAKLDARVAALEDKVDARLRETRPIWENVQARLTTIEAALDEIRLQIIELHRDSLGLRSRIARLEDRERPPVS